jgi:hypothetical protein
MVYGRVKSIFDSRAYKFKNAIRSLPMWFKVIVYVAWLSSIHLIDSIPRRTRIVTAIVIYLIIPALVGLELFQTRVQVKTDSQKTTCLITAVTDDKLTCSQSVLSRAEIKTIRLTNKAKSTVTGLLIGAGAGSGVGAGIGSAINAGK